MDKAIRIVTCFIVLMICAYSIFQDLGKDPLRLWDESRYANNALEMVKGGNPIVVTYNGESDRWNAKPPFSVWMQSISMRIFGFNEFGVRFHSALFGLLTCAALIFFSHKVLGNINIGYIAALILVTLKGYVKPHVVRSGDVDSTLIFFMTCYALTYFTLLQSIVKGEKLNKKYLTLFCIFVLLASYTKGVASFMGFGGMMVFTLIDGKLLPIMKSVRFHIGWLSVAILFFGYYFLREAIDHGYIQGAIDMDFGIFNNKSDYKKESFSYYFDIFQKVGFVPYVPWLIPAFILGVISKNPLMRKITIYSLLFSLCFFLAHSSSGTKNDWYGAPGYVFPCFIIAVGLYEVYGYAKAVLPEKVPLSVLNILSIAVLVYILYKPYKDIIAFNKYNPRVFVDFREESTFMREMKRQRPDIKNYMVITSDSQWADQISFYKKAYYYTDNFNINYKRSADNPEYKVGDVILTCQMEYLWNTVKSKYKFTVIKGQFGCSMVRIDGFNN